MNLLKKYHILALTALLSACSSATLTGYSEEGKTEISAGSALPSDNHAAAVQEKTQEAASAPAKEQKIASKEENTKTKTSKVQKEDAKKADAKKTETKAEQKPLVDKITTEKDPDESDKKTAIHYMTDEEFIASVEKLDSVETTPVETEELNEPAQTSTQKSAAQSPAKEKSAPQVEAVFVPTISYQLDTFYFANGSATLDSKYRKNIQKIAAEAKKHKNYIIRVSGHASSRTNDTDIASHKLANFKVSQKRANSVAQALRKAGIPSSKIVVEALSDSAPAYLEVMPEGERLNRRAEVFISY